MLAPKRISLQLEKRVTLVFHALEPHAMKRLGAVAAQPVNPITIRPQSCATMKKPSH